jgi:hypothetical protein
LDEHILKKEALMARVLATTMFRKVTPDVMTATVEFRQRQERRQQARDDYAAGKISAEEAGARQERANQDFTEAYDSGDLHIEI